MLHAIVLTTLLQLPVSQLRAAEDTPASDASFLALQVSTEERARQRAVLAGRPTPSEEIAAHLRLEAKVSAVRAAYRLLDVDVTEIARGLELLASARHNLEDDGTSLRADLLRLIPRLNERLESLPRDESAEAAYQLLMLEQWVDRGTDNGQSRRDAYLARYAGTARAVLMQLLADAPREPLAKQEFVDHTRTLASEHEGTPRGVAALYALAIWQIDRARADADPSIALLEVFDILKQMERAHLQAEWEESVRRMLREFRFRAAVNVAPPAGMERLYSAYLDFIVAHRSEVWLIRHTVSRFASREFERIPTVERFFADLEARNVGIDATRYQRAEFYRSFMDPDRTTEGDPRIDQLDAERLVRESLAALSRSADAVWRARAVAAAAALDFSLGRYADARAGYAAYITEFPDNDYAWIAAIRAAQSRETLGDTPGAAADFEAAMERFKDRPYAKVLAGIAAANIREAAGDLAGALRNYRAATEAWANVPDRINIYYALREGIKPPAAPDRFASVTRGAIAAKVERLARLSSADAVAVYRAEVALAAGNPGEAIKLLRPIVNRTSSSSETIAEARSVSRRARFTLAVMQATSQQSRSRRELDRLTRESYDSVTTLSKLALAGLRLRSGTEAQANMIVEGAVAEWFAKQQPINAPVASVEREVAAILSELFKPLGGAGTNSPTLNALNWPRQPPALLLVTTQVVVRTTDGNERTYQMRFPTPPGPKVIFAEPDVLSGLKLILDHIGGEEKEEPVNVMDVPNQPIGWALRIAELWAKHFPLRQGHWAGWAFAPFSNVWRVTFDRDNHALAEFSTGYDGGTVELEKNDGVWIVKRVVSHWIT